MRIIIASIISIVWMYLVVGVIIAKWAYEPHANTTFQKLSFRMKIRWIMAESIVVLFWPALVLLGIVEGIKQTIC